MVIAIGNQKGGSGKSTIALNLAIKLLEFSDKVLVMDTDPQKSIESFTNIRESRNDCEKLPHFTLTNRTGNITESLKQMVGIYDYVVIDTRGSDSQESRKAMICADKLLVPTTPSQLDIDVLIENLGRVKEIKDINENLSVSILMNKINPNPFLAKELADFKEAIFRINKSIGEDFTCLESSLCERISYKRAVSEGLGITEYIDIKAKNEFEAFFSEFLENLNQSKSA